MEERKAFQRCQESPEDEEVCCSGEERGLQSQTAQLSYLQAVRLWANGLTSLCFRVLVHEIEIIIVSAS